MDILYTLIVGYSCGRAPIEVTHHIFDTTIFSALLVLIQDGRYNKRLNTFEDNAFIIS